MNTKWFWLNYLIYLLVLTGVIFVLSIGFEEEGFDLSRGFFIVSFFGLLALGYFIIKELSGRNNEKDK